MERVVKILSLELKLENRAIGADTLLKEDLGMDSVDSIFITLAVRERVSNGDIR